mgnify:CR=1 FL=1
MADYHFIGGDGKSYGPYTAEQMREFMAQNRLAPTSQVRVDDGPLQPASSFPEIASGHPVPGPAVPNYLVHSILVTLCCCMPFGIVAIVFCRQGGWSRPIGSTRRSGASLQKGQDVVLDRFWRGHPSHDTCRRLASGCGNDLIYVEWNSAGQSCSLIMAEP